MNMKLDITLKKSFVVIAKVEGTLEIKMLAETITGNIVKNKIVDALKEKGFKGRIYTNGSYIEL